MASSALAPAVRRRRACDPEISALHRRASHSPGVIALAGGLPADELLPRTMLAAALADAATDTEALQYSWPEGLAPLRDWIAMRLVARGARIDPAGIIVTAGAQQALAIAAAVLGDAPIGVGAATYPGALATFRHARRDAVIRYVIAGVGNPHGVDILDRAALLAGDAELVVDEAYAELRFDGAVHRPLLADARDRVWHIGTISKTVCPGLRVGWLVAPPHRRAAALDTKQALDLQTCTIAQAAFVRLLDRLDHDALLVRARASYAARADRLVSALARHAPELRFREPEGGFSLWVETTDDGDDIALLAAAIAAGVSIDPGRMFRPDHASSPVAFRLSFSHAPLPALDDAVRRLARALATWRRAR